MPRGEGPGAGYLSTPEGYKSYYGQYPQGYPPIAPLATPTVPVVPPYTRNVQTFTGSQLTGLGADYAYGSPWWSSYNPQGELTTPEQWASAYGNTPVATGYKDEQGNWVISPQTQAYQAWKLRSMQFPGLTDVTQTPSYGGLQELINQLKQGPNFGGAASYAAGIMGTTPEQYQQSMGGLLGQLGKGVSGQEGLPKEQMDLMNRQAQWQVDDMREQMTDIVGALAGSGRSIQAIQAMDEIASQIRDTYAQSKLTQWNLNLATQKLQYDAAMQQYGMMSQLGLQGAEQFLNNIRANQESQLQAYAQDISTLMQQDAMEIEAFKAHADQYYKSFMVDLGLDEAALDKTYNLYAQWLTPILDQLMIGIQEQMKTYIPKMFD